PQAGGPSAAVEQRSRHPGDREQRSDPDRACARPLIMKLTTIVVSGAFILIVATLLNIGQLYFMAGMLSALPLVCYASGRWQRGGLRAGRSMADNAVEGQAFTVTLEIENNERLPKPHLLVEDRLPPWLVREDATGPLPAQVGSFGRTTLEYTVRPE